MPGNDGEDSDAVGAYTQVKLKDMPGYVETWISLPKQQQPTHWWKIEDPVCLLELNLYGHPLAGLFWEQHCREKILKAGFVPIKGWECLYANYDKQLFLSVYVDDFKMAGKKENMTNMWQELSKELELDPPSKLVDNIYLGCGQTNVIVPPAQVEAKRNLLDKLLGQEKERFSPSNRPA